MPVWIRHLVYCHEFHEIPAIKNEIIMLTEIGAEMFSKALAEKEIPVLLGKWIVEWEGVRRKSSRITLSSEDPQFDHFKSSSWNKLKLQLKYL